MSLLTRIRKQTATYWGSPTPNGLGGNTYAAPVSLLVRWEDCNEVVTDSKGDQIVSKSIVYVGQDVETEGYLFLGTSASTDPTEVEGAFRIQKFDKVPNLRISEYLRIAYL